MANTISKFTNENIIKLKELSDRICKYEMNEEAHEKFYVDIINEIKNIVDEESNNVKSDVDKLNSYERMCYKIKIILNKLKLA